MGTAAPILDLNLWEEFLYRRHSACDVHAHAVDEGQDPSTFGGSRRYVLRFASLSSFIHRDTPLFCAERVDYYTNMNRIARTDPITRYTLLSIKGEGKGADPILPLESDSPDAFRNSPLFALVDPHSTDAELSETASSLMGPGPWTFHQELQLPKSCNVMKFTNRNRRSNIIITHLIKVIMRVERGDDIHVDGKTGKRKLFDIVVQTPILILSVGWLFIDRI